MQVRSETKGSFLSESLMRLKNIPNRAENLNFHPYSDLEYFFELHQTFCQKLPLLKSGGNLPLLGSNSVNRSANNSGTPGLGIPAVGRELGVPWQVS